MFIQRVIEHALLCLLPTNQLYKLPEITDTQECNIVLSRVDSLAYQNCISTENLNELSCADGHQQI